MMYRRAALALAGTVGLLVLFGVEPYKALIEERTGWRPSESPARSPRGHPVQRHDRRPVDARRHVVGRCFGDARRRVAGK